MLTLNLFGSPTILLDGQKVSGFASRKAEGLLFYLAHSERSHARESLATLLWDDRSHEQALANLSVLLSSLRKSVGDFLYISRHEVRLQAYDQLCVDTHCFEQAISRAEPHFKSGSSESTVGITGLRSAVALYRDQFLSGFTLREATGFEEWLFVERERLQRLAIHTLERIASYELEQSHWHDVIAHTQRLLQIDPLHEPAYRLLMESLARNGQRSAAIDCYLDCKRRLQEELEVTPAAETIALYERIGENGFQSVDTLQGTLPMLSPSHLIHPAAIPIALKLVVKRNLPKPLNNFVGRQQELAELASLLHDPSYRLISLIGPGGIGKTRLAIEAARHLAEEEEPQFSDGVWLIELDALSQADQVLNTIADVLSFRFVEGQRRLEELLAYLQQKQMLLLFDNFEHLLDAAEVLHKILEHAPNLVALITSRERLNLPGETVVAIGGLESPACSDSNPGALHRYSATQLFIDRAQRADGDFRLTPSEAPYLIQLCQQLDGVPLALELAAAWVRTLSCAEIATEIARSIDFLSSDGRAMAPRHRSLRAVFEHSWRLLNPAEQNALAKLSLFRGGFSREAAATVADAPLRVLVSLLDKSLIRRSSGSRYAIHPLLAQFSAEKLAGLITEVEKGRSRHCHYFAHFLHQRKEDLERSRQVEALAEMDAERENLREAYRWAVEHADLDAIALALEGFLAYLDVRCHGIEAMTMAEHTQRMLEPIALAGNQQAHHLWGEALVHHAMFRSFEYDNNLAVALAKQALTILQAHSDVAGVAFSHNSLGLAQMQRGEMESALINFERAVELRKKLGKDALVASSLINIAQIAWRRGEYQKAEEVCQTALGFAQKSGNPWRIAMVLNVLGILAKELQRYADAERFLQESGEVYQTVGNRWGISSIISERGVIAYLQQKYTLARTHFERSIAIRLDLGNVIHRAGDLLWLGKVAEAQAQPDEAEEHYRLAWQLLEPMDEPINKATAIFLLTKLRRQQGTLDRIRAVEQLELALQLAQTGESQPLVEEIVVEIGRLGDFVMPISQSPNLLISGF